MSSLKASIDLGTNTFHILIAHIDGAHIIPVHKERKYVFLGEYGIQNIGDAPYNRALQALNRFSDLLREHDVRKVNISGTAALRTAENGQQLKSEMETIIAHPIRIIDGLKEAHLVAQGVFQALGPKSIAGMIVDIGGGSTEIVVFKHKNIIWSTSNPFGLATLHRQFHNIDPLTGENALALIDFISEQICTEDLKQILKEHGVNHLIGAAGTFEVFAEDTLYSNTPCQIISRQSVSKKWTDTHIMPETARAQEAWIPKERVKYIVEGLAILESLRLNLPQLDTWIYSPNSLKEGLLLES